MLHACPSLFTMPHNIPTFPEAPPIRGREAGSFAEYTLRDRLPGIARRVIRENAFDDATATRLETLAHEVNQGALINFADPDAPDGVFWERQIEPYRGQNWYEPPWFFAETLFFRAILAATGYFQPGSGQGIDPYAQQKRQGLEAALRSTAALAERGRQARKPQSEVVVDALHAALWGNQADLSLWPIGGNDAAPGLHTRRLLHDDAAMTTQYLQTLPRPERIDLVLDNTGAELLADLTLVDTLLDRGIASHIQLHVKPYPTYVSDCTAADVAETIDRLATDTHPELQLLGKRLADALADKRITTPTHWFWTSPLAGWDLPDDLRMDLTSARLVISKGDANYRRWLGDRHWPATTPFAAIVNYMPAPLLALRVLKAEVVCGLAPGQAEELTRHDPRWRISGAYGVIQFAAPPGIQR